MSIFDIFKQNKTSYSKENYSSQASISNEEYQNFRKMQVTWLESHYDLNSAKGIQSIPASPNLPKPPSGAMDVTGDIDYYLRQKAGEHEKAGKIDLAILCLKKSNDIRMVTKKGYRKSDYYMLVRLLARNGYIDEAHEEKARIDLFFGDCTVDSLINIEPILVKRVLDDARQARTDLVIMSAHGAACPECAKYQGRVFSLSGKSKMFPKIPDAFFTYGCIHKGCGHTFFSYIHGVTDPQLDYTLTFQTNVKWWYRRNIVAFSNRPFVDDRRKEDIDRYWTEKEKQDLEEQRRIHAEETMIETEAKRGREAREFSWIQENLPDLCPKSLAGYRRMKSNNSKNYQKIMVAAEQKGFSLSTPSPSE